MMDTYNEVERITRMVLQTIENAKENENRMTVPVGVSARHIHLTQEDVEKLFGAGYQLTKKKDLMGGQFAANEQCTVVGLKLRAIENVRILGPVRKNHRSRYPLRMRERLASMHPYASPYDSGRGGICITA